MLESKAVRILLFGGVLFLGTSCADDGYSELNVEEKGGGYYEEDESKKKTETAPLSE